MQYFPKLCTHFSSPVVRVTCRPLNWSDNIWWRIQLLKEGKALLVTVLSHRLTKDWQLCNCTQPGKILQLAIVVKVMRLSSHHLRATDWHWLVRWNVSRRRDACFILYLRLMQSSTMGNLKQVNTATHQYTKEWKIIIVILTRMASFRTLNPYNRSTQHCCTIW
jgi:hypothetical protein